MSDHVTLLGAEQVKSAGRNIQSSAEQIDRASNVFSEAASSLIRSTDEAISRLEQVQLEQVQLNGSRTCWYKTAPCGNWKGGKHHAWSTDHEKTEDGGVVLFPVGVVEDDSDRQIRSVPIAWISFAASPPGG